MEGMERQLIRKIVQYCQHYRNCWVGVGHREEALKVKNALETVCLEVRRKLKISEPELLVALLDAYEVTQDEGMLQEVLDKVSGELEWLPVTVESVTLLAYCYYYVEEEECAERAWKMLEKLRQAGEDIGEVEQVVEEMVGVKSKR